MIRSVLIKKSRVTPFVFSSKNRGDIDTLYSHLVEIDAKIVHEPEIGGWAPGYYSILLKTLQEHDWN